MGSCIWAFGLRQACFRQATAIAPNCRDVVPYSCMWRRAASAYSMGADMAPNGSRKSAPGVARRPWLGRPREDDWLSPLTHNTVEHRPDSMAVMALTTHEADAAPPRLMSLM